MNIRLVLSIEDLEKVIQDQVKDPKLHEAIKEELATWIENDKVVHIDFDLNWETATVLKCGGR